MTRPDPLFKEGRIPAQNIPDLRAQDVSAYPTASDYPTEHSHFTALRQAADALGTTVAPDMTCAAGRPQRPQPARL